MYMSVSLVALNKVTPMHSVGPFDLSCKSNGHVPDDANICLSHNLCKHSIKLTDKLVLIALVNSMTVY